MVRVHKSSVFLCKRKSRSLSIDLVGEAGGELGGVILSLGPLSLLCRQGGDGQGMYEICEVDGMSWKGCGAKNREGIS